MSSVPVQKSRFLPLILLVAPLWACSPPQDVANVQQVVAGADDPQSAFAVQPVTGLTLPMVQGWPASATSSYPWVRSGSGSMDPVITPGDQISLAIWGNSENALLTDAIQLPNLKVSSEGTVFLPYVDEVPVAGLSPAAARAEIQTRLATLIPAVQVQLDHVSGSRNSVEVLSGLPQNGSFPLPTGDTRVTAILAAAGGVPDAVNNPQVSLQRGGKLYRVGVKTLFENPGLDAVLQGGDRLYVTPDERYFLSLGAAGKEALINFPKDEISTLDAMSLVGGVDQGTADPRGVLVLRTYPASAVAANPDLGPPKRQMIFAFDLTSADGLFAAGAFPIQDRDLVLVTQSPLVNTRTILSFVSGFIGSARSAANGLN